MTTPTPGVPYSPTIEALRVTIAAYDEPGADKSLRAVETTLAAKAVLAEYDRQVAAVNAAMTRAAAENLARMASMNPPPTAIAAGGNGVPEGTVPVREHGTDRIVGYVQDGIVITGGGGGTGGDRPDGH